MGRIAAPATKPAWVGEKMEGGYHESLERALQPLEQLDRKALEYVARDLPLSKRSTGVSQAGVYPKRGATATSTAWRNHGRRGGRLGMRPLPSNAAAASLLSDPSIQDRLCGTDMQIELHIYRSIYIYIHTYIYPSIHLY